MDKRAEPRISHQVRFFVHIKECNEDGELVGLSLECDAIDFSKRGMQFSADIELYPRNVLGITIGIGEPFSMYELAGSVRWTLAEKGRYCFGVLLDDRPNTDYEKWELAFSQIFEA